MKTYNKYCPLIKDKCRGYECAFAAQGSNTAVGEDGHLKVVGKYNYCLVRDFMLTISMG